MSAAAQTQTQQPAFVYPSPETRQTPSSSHSDGSFGTVFIVLAVIVVISAIACVLGRLCNRRAGRPKPPKQNHHGQKSQNHNGFRPKERDIEFGFDKRTPPFAKPASNGDLRGLRMPEHGEFRGETKSTEAGGELKGSA